MSSQLPTECWEEIFKNLDIHSLHTAILINRTSFIAGIGILWSNPFEIFQNSESTKNESKLIDIYLSYLSQESKDKILELSIVGKIQTKQTYFPYISLLRTLHLPYTYRAISMWLKENDEALKENPDFADLDGLTNLAKKMDIIIRELTVLFFNQSNIEKIYIDKSESIQGSFGPYVNTDAYDDYTAIVSLHCWDSFLISLTRLPNVRNGLSRLRSLHCESCLPSEFFFGLAEICHNIKEIELDCGCIESNGLVALIKAQKKGLDSFSLKANISMPLLVNALSSKVSTLKHLKFSGHYKMPLAIFSKSPLNSLTVEGYERVRKEYFEPLTSNPVQKLWKLELDLVGLPIEPLMILIRNSGPTLQEIYLQWQYVADGHNTPSLFNSIAENCTQLISLKIPVNSKTALQLDEITHSNPNLKNLILQGDTIPGHKIDVSEGLIKLANPEFIPKKLECLHLSHDVMLNNINALDIFFTNFSELKTISTKPLKFKENEGLVGKKFIEDYNNIIAKHFIEHEIPQ